jgi:predicted dehydrogenase
MTTAVGATHASPLLTNQAKRGLSRRQLIGGAAAGLAAYTIVPRHCLGGRGETSPNEKIRIATVGAGGQAGWNINELEKTGQVEFVALCDVDTERAGKNLTRFPQARIFRDFRKMFDEMDRSIDAVLVATPDHVHAVAAMAALKRGKHVYCEKPLAHSVHEIRELMKAARENKVITQFGNQGHSFASSRTFCEWIWDDAIGKVHIIHAGCASPNSALDHLSEVGTPHPVPATLDWDLWLGPAAFRAYNPMYCPGKWRSWMPFGTGTPGDWTCHVVDPVFWALDLGAPISVQAQAKDYDPIKHADTFPRGSIVKHLFPAKGDRGPVTLYWYSGTEAIPHPEGLEPERKVPATGAIVLGDKGGISYGSHGAGSARLFPETKMRAYQEKLKSTPVRRPLPRPGRNHHQDWLHAIRTGKPAGSDFSYGGPLTEIAMLSIIAIRMLGQELKWDAQNMRFTNSPEATALLTPQFRAGWTL